jgi:hypothetical protein
MEGWREEGREECSGMMTYLGQTGLGLGVVLALKGRGLHLQLQQGPF